MADTFDAFNPPKKQTDPAGLGAASRDYPAHVHQWAGRDEDGNVLRNHFKVVNSAQEKADALDAGWSETPVHTEPEGHATDETDEAPAHKTARKPGRPKKD